MDRAKISNAVIRRMPKYYRHLNDLKREGVLKISSNTLAANMGLTASQIRQDFNCFGGFGQQGYGYNVESLMKEIAAIIGIDRLNRAVVIGVGNIGKALLHNFNFGKCGFTLVAAFDTDEKIVGTKIDDIPIYHVDELEKFNEESSIDVAVLTLPKKPAPEMAERLAKMGVRGIWNFTNIDLKMKHPEVMIEDVHFSDSLMTLCYQITE